MRRFQQLAVSLLLCLAAAVPAIATQGCKGPPTVDRVQPNLVDKSIFEGEWWMSQTAIDVDADARGITWSGDSGFADLALDGGQSIPLARVRWVIDENTLFAYRAYELVDGSSSGNDTADDTLGQPIAAYRIEDHVDVRAQYNPVTGERLNVTEENTSDRRWYERQFMRVDWSENLIDSFYFASENPIFGGYSLESAGIDIQEAGAHPEFPESYAPEFITVAMDEDYRFRDEWPEDQHTSVHYFAFVNIMNMSPGADCLNGGSPCGVVRAAYRTSFLRVPPEHEYAVARQTHPEFDRFGTFRLMQRTYIRGGEPRETRGDYCDASEDCGTGGFCDVAAHQCSGGLTPAYGETDSLTFYRPRHGLFADSLTDTECVADWQCDGRYAEAGVPGSPGSVCDRAAERCTIPLRERPLRTVRYHLNAGYPAHLVSAAFEVVGNWNEAFMRGQRAATDQALPDYAAVQIDCQTADPTRYCFCGSAEEREGSCAGRYDPFIGPDVWTGLGVTDPYDCVVVNDAFSEPTSPGSFGDYALPAAYRYQFVGEECRMVLETNACDWHREDRAVHCDDVVTADGEDVAWEKLGDLRYQFFNYVDQVNVPFGGVAAPLADPTTGELISANASFGAGAVENAGTRALDFFPVLRCEGDAGCEPGDEGAEDRYLTGENLRGYFSRLGRTEHPVSVVSSGGAGFGTDDPSRPGLPVDPTARIREALTNASARLEPLRGQNGRTQIMSDCLRGLSGTSFETRLMSSLGSGGVEALQRGLDLPQASNATSLPSLLGGGASATSVLDDDVLNALSPMRGNQPEAFIPDERVQRAMEAHHLCPVNEGLFRSRYWEYWAEAFRGRPDAEASIRMQQLYTRMVQHHELGHSVGLRHNFGASFDRNNYGDGWFSVVFGDPDDDSDDLLLPRYQDFDQPANGGDGDGFVGPGEVESFLTELRRVRDARAERGAHNHTTGSTMDYNGDTSDAQGLGRYDVAATVWNYFDLVEAFEGDVETSSGDSSDRLLRSDLARRTWFRSYLGGESCDVDADCPFAAGTGALLDGQPIHQRCVRNPREVPIQFACGGATNCVCSTFDADFVDFEDGAAYDFDTDRNGEPDFTAVPYLFCSDERTNDISWCNRFDAGESFQEAIDHYRRIWTEGYARSYYRRFRRGGARGGGAIGSIIDAAKIYQHLFFRFNFEPGFSNNDGPLGFEDQFYASVDAMNWFIELVNLPDEGSYAFDAATNSYAHVSAQPDAPGSDFSLLPGQGFGMWTEYQDGYFGYFRPERAGVFMDKFVALQALAIRDWGFSFNADERYFINFYDLFPTEMTELFGGLVLDETSWFAPRVELNGAGEPVVTNMSWYRGTALGECTNPLDGETIPCRGSQETVYPGASIEGTSNEILRSWAAVLALAQFPVFYDTVFEQRLQIFRVGSGAGFEIPDAQLDNQAPEAYGAAIPGTTHPVTATPEDADYAIYESERLGFAYVAVKIRPSRQFNLDEEQLGFELIRRLIDQQERVRTLELMGPSDELTEARRDLEANESFAEYLIDLQAQYGISNTFF